MKDGKYAGGRAVCLVHGVNGHLIPNHCVEIINFKQCHEKQCHEKQYHEKQCHEKQCFLDYLDVPGWRNMAAIPWSWLNMVTIKQW